MLVLQAKTSCCWWWQLFLKSGGMSDARMAVCIDSWTLRKEEEGTLGQQPNWTSVPISQSGSHPLLGVIPRPHQRASARQWELVLRLGWGWPLKAPSLVAGELSHREPCSLQSVLVSFGFPVSFRQEAVGRALPISCSWNQPGLRAPSQACLEEGVGWGGGCSEGKGK